MTNKEMIIIFSRQISKNKLKEAFLKWILIFQKQFALNQIFFVVCRKKKKHFLNKWMSIYEEKWEVRLRNNYNILKRIFKEWKMRHEKKCEVRLKIKFIALKDSVAIWKARVMMKTFYGISH
jgi:hypothetical protein